MADRTCSINGCERPHYGRGWCQMHYKRWRSTFWSRVDKNGPASWLGTRCWNWTGCSSHGYGLVSYHGEQVSTHRLAYQLATGIEPEQVDHKCHNTLCVNPTHLRSVTNKQNCENRAGLASNNTSGVRGVSWKKKEKRWMAYVHHNSKRIHVGYFTNLADAEAAVVAKRNELFTHNDLDRAS